MTYGCVAGAMVLAMLALTARGKSTALTAEAIQPAAYTKSVSYDQRQHTLSYGSEAGIARGPAAAAGRRDIR